MRDRAYARIGHLYPAVKVIRQRDGTYRHATTEEIKHQKGSVETLTVIAWLWARTVPSPNPAYSGIPVPLISSFWLSTKKDKEAWVEPVVNGKTYCFEVRTGIPHNKALVDAGTKLGRGANFRCILSDSPMSADYIRQEAQTSRMGARLMAIVAEGEDGRTYLPPTAEMEEIARRAKPAWKPDQLVTKPSHDVDRLPMYGMPTWGDAFTPRQLVALTTFSDLVAEAREQIRIDALTSGLANDPAPLRDGGMGAMAYAEAVSVYLSFAVDKGADAWSSLVSWRVQVEASRNTFARQALPMVWDYTEINPFSSSVGNFEGMAVDGIWKVVSSMPTMKDGQAMQADATQVYMPLPAVVSTDPPYYDNIGYADLSDFFYVWLRRCLQSIYPELFSTILVPKAEELVAVPYRHGSRQKADHFFLAGMSRALHLISERAHTFSPVTVYYAFKQSESDSEGTVSTGWETFLDAVINAGFTLTGTWPIRKERPGKITAKTNILASSIVLVCRPRRKEATITTRREFINTLKRELPTALRTLQSGYIAPVDLAQASIGPGMAIFSRYSKTLEADGSPMRVRAALQLINQTLDEVVAEQEGDFDPDTGWAVAWFDQFGFNDGPYGEAETLTKAKNTAINGLQAAGIVTARGGRVRLVRVDELSDDWDPTTDNRLTVWEIVHHLIKTLETGEGPAAELVAKLGSKAEVARELAYRLYTICERKKRAAEALAYNGLVQSWPEIARLARETPQATPVQTDLL
jgi:putative DNA methylase